MKKKILILISFILIQTSGHSEVINDLIVKGNKRISKNTIVEIIDFKKGNNYSITDFNKMQKELFKTNFFSNVQIKFQNSTIYIEVSENPLVQYILIDGAIEKKIEDEIIDNIALSQNNTFSEPLLLESIQKIRNIFKNKGYFDVNVYPEVSLSKDNTVNVVLRISDQKKYKIHRIFFIGDKYFSSSKLLSVISSSEYGWWRLLSSSDTLVPERVDYDKSLLKRFYLNNGFYNVQILSEDIDIKSDEYGTLTFSINSGNIFLFDKINIIDVENNLSDGELDYIQELSKQSAIGRYSLKKINTLIKDINNYLRLKNKNFVKAAIIERDNLAKQTIDVDIKFTKTKQYYVNLIKISGNSITEEEVIRRKIEFSEGDAFSEYKLKNSIDRLKSTGIFGKIDAKTINIDQEQVDVEITVEEKPTGSISAGVGIGSSGSVVSTGINEDNLFGKGIKTYTNLSLGTEKISGNVSTTIPDFRNSDNDFIFDLYALATDYENVGYESTVVGSDISTNYNILKDVYLKTGVGLNRDKITANDTASALYKNRAGNYITYKAFYNIVSDKRDSRFQPTEGYRLGFGQTLGMPGSDISYLENSLFGTYYYPFDKDYIFNIKGGIKSINSLENDDIKLSDRNFLSNRNLRGFENFAVGPKDGEEHIGGNYTAYSSLSTTVPNPLPDTLNANTSIFLDFGNVWGVDFDNSKDSDKIRSSTGLSLDWISPIGPVSFVFSQVLSSAEGDIKESFNFQLGTSF